MSVRKVGGQSRVEGQRLDVVLQRLKESDKPSSVLDIHEIPEFDAELADDFESSGSEQQGSIETLLIDFIMPVVSDIGIFHDSRAIMLLEHLRDELLPYLDNNEELASLATQVIDDEIARHDLIRERRQAGIAL